MHVEACLASVETALIDGDADLLTDLGGQHEPTSARLWRGQVLIDWEPDAQAGGCLLRTELLRRLLQLHALVRWGDDRLVISARGRVVAALSADHADLVSRLGGASRVEFEAVLRFDGPEYRGGCETYYLVEHGERVPLLRLMVKVRPRQQPVRSAREASPRSSPATT